MRKPDYHDYHSEPEQQFYKSRVWRERIRPRILDRDGHLCAFCQLLGWTTRATVVDHIHRPLGNRELQRDERNLQCLCNEHSLLKSNAERNHKDDMQPLIIKLANGRDGWPVEWTRPPKPEPREPVFA
jgi:5-methylcytosine-specific restriction endonuclease McrA